MFYNDVVAVHGQRYRTYVLACRLSK